MALSPFSKRGPCAQNPYSDMMDIIEDELSEILDTSPELLNQIRRLHEDSIFRMLMGLNAPIFKEPVDHSNNEQKQNNA